MGKSVNRARCNMTVFHRKPQGSDDAKPHPWIAEQFASISQAKANNGPDSVVVKSKEELPT